MGGESTDVVSRYLFAIPVVVLAQPIPGESLHDEGRLVTVASDGVVESSEVVNGSHDPAGAHHVVEVSIHIVVDHAFDEVCIEPMSKSRKLLRSLES